MLGLGGAPSRSQEMAPRPEVIPVPGCMARLWQGSAAVSVIHHILVF
jgi:hypothetical protein